MAIRVVQRLSALLERALDRAVVITDIRAECRVGDKAEELGCDLPGSRVVWRVVGACSWRLYSGPVWIDFEIPFEAQKLAPEKKVATVTTDYTVEPKPEYRGHMSLGDMALETPLCDWSHMMRGNVMKFAFPHLHKWVDEQDESSPDNLDDEGNPAEHYPASLRAALVADLEPLVRHSQAVAALEARDDHEARVMKELNVTVMPPSWTADEEEDSDDDDDSYDEVEGDEGDEDDEYDGFTEEDAKDAVVYFANAFAKQLGVMPEQVLAALGTEEVGGSLEHFYEVITAMREAGDPLRGAGARLRLLKPKDGGDA